MRDILQGKLYQNFVRRFYKIALAGSNKYNGSETSSPPNGPISCQYKPTQNIKEKFLFDLQTVAFWVLKKARCIAETIPF